MNGNQNQRPHIKDHYTYVAKVSTLAAAASLTDTVTIEADSDFVWVKASYFADIAGAAQTQSTFVVPLVTLVINDSGSGRNLQNEAVPLDSIAGRGLLPFVLPVPRQFKARSSINFTFANYSAATAYANVYLSLIGYKMIYTG